MEQLLEVAAQDLDERKQLFAEAQRVFAEELPAIHFAAPVVYVAHGARVANARPALLQAWVDELRAHPHGYQTLKLGFDYLVGRELPADLCAIAHPSNTFDRVEQVDGRIVREEELVVRLLARGKGDQLQDGGEREVAGMLAGQAGAGLQQGHQQGQLHQLRRCLYPNIILRYHMLLIRYQHYHR